MTDLRLCEECGHTMWLNHFADGCNQCDCKREFGGVG